MNSKMTDNTIRIIRNSSPTLSHSPLSDSSNEHTWSDVERVEEPPRMTHSQILGSSHDSIPEDAPLAQPLQEDAPLEHRLKEETAPLVQVKEETPEAQPDVPPPSPEVKPTEQPHQDASTNTEKENKESTESQLPSVMVTDIDVRQLIRNAVSEAFCEVIADVLNTIKEMEQTAESVKNDDTTQVAPTQLEDPYADMPPLVEDSDDNNSQHEPIAPSMNLSTTPREEFWATVHSYEEDGIEYNVQKSSITGELRVQEGRRNTPLYEPEIELYENGKIAIYEEPKCKRCATVIDLILSHQQEKFMKKISEIEDTTEVSSTEEVEEDEDDWDKEESSTDDSTSDEESEEPSEEESTDTTSSDSDHKKVRRHRHRDEEVPTVITFCFTLLIALYILRIVAMWYERHVFARGYYS